MVVSIISNIYYQIRPVQAVVDVFSDYGGGGEFTDEISLLSFPADPTPENFLGFILLDGAVTLDSSNPLSNTIPDRNGLIIYKIKSGDTLSTIAASFGISLDTIIGANPDVRGASLKPGEEIVILPVSGVLHKVEAGDTLDSLAAFYNVNPESIINFNKNLQESLNSPGSSVIIPGVRSSALRSIATYKQKDLPSIANYFVIPTTGWNWGTLHNYNAVDIANSCGTPVYAAAEGLIVEEYSSGWNSGYGSYVKIEHPNQIKTLYAHLSRTKVNRGDYVLQGDLIGYIGNTGKTHGPTGCHLHFEVYGARNPFQK